MSSRPTVSIAMATYNGATFIKEQLECFARQKILPDELVVTDDASHDGTLDIVNAFAASAPFPVRIKRNSERLGYRANFMQATSLCESDLIALSDQDDVWLPRKLEACLGAFDDRDTLLVHHNGTVVTRTLEPICPILNAHAPRRSVHPPRSTGPWQFELGFTMVFRRELARFPDFWRRSIDFQTGELEAHDQWFCFLASCLGTIRYVAEPLALYRQHSSNAYGWMPPSSGLRSKWQRLMSTHMTTLKAREVAAERRALLLEEMRMKFNPDQKHLAGLAALSYRELAAIYQSRQELYRSDTFLSRLNALRFTANAGGYKPKDQWGVGREALARDLIRGVLFPARGKKAREL